MTLTNEAACEEIAAQIGWFYFNKAREKIGPSDDRRTYELTEHEYHAVAHEAECLIKELGITAIKYDENKKVVIHLRKPGLLIGWHGTVIDALNKYLDKVLITYEIQISGLTIKEDKDIPGLFNFTYGNGWGAFDEEEYP